MAPFRVFGRGKSLESRLHKAIRKMIGQKMCVSAAFVTHEGKMVHPVDGYLLTTGQILELDSKTSLRVGEFGSSLNA